MIRSLRYDVFDYDINMEFLNKNKVIKQYRQCLMNSEDEDFSRSVIQNFLELKVRTIVIVHENNLEYWCDTLHEYYLIVV